MPKYSVKVLRVQGEIALEVEAANQQAALSAALEESKAGVFREPEQRRMAILAQHCGVGCDLVHGASTGHRS
jgi:hypothetical protein